MTTLHDLYFLHFNGDESARWQGGSSLKDDYEERLRPSSKRTVRWNAPLEKQSVKKFQQRKTGKSRIRSSNFDIAEC